MLEYTTVVGISAYNTEDYSKEYLYLLCRDYWNVAVIVIIDESTNRSADLIEKIMTNNPKDYLYNCR